MRSLHLHTLLLTLLLASAACGGGGEPDKAPPTVEEKPTKPDAPPPVTSTAPSAKEEARQIFNTRCFVCHGMEGRGDGPGAVALEPKPRNYQDKKWQATVTDEQIENIIRVGGQAVKLSPLMPPNPDLVPKPEVVAELRKIVRGFSK